MSALRLGTEGYQTDGVDGKVGISTSSPYNKLSVKEDSSITQAIFGQDRTSSQSQIAIGEQDTSDKSFNIGFDHSNKYGYLQISGDSIGTAIVVANGAYVGVGTTAPSQKLDVNGNGRFRSVGSGAYNAPLNLTSDGTLTTSTSDRRKKKDISNLKNALTKVTKLRGVYFNWKGSKGKHIGMIAQEVEKIYPELVFTNQTDGFKGIHYTEMTAVLVEAIKEQQTRIEALEKQLSKKGQKNTRL